MKSNTSTRARAYIDAAIDGVLADLRNAPHGGRNHALNTAAFALGRLVGAGALDASIAVQWLHEGARIIGLDGDEARATIRSGLRAGARSPRSLPADLEIERPARIPEPPLERPLPPAHDVADLWVACIDPRDDKQVRGYLDGRGLDVDAIADLDLVRALPSGTALPAFARGPFGSWLDTGHRALVPLYDATGELRGLLARNGHGAAPKALGMRRGLVMADAGARALLGGADDLGGTRVHVIIGEGDPDFLALATGPAAGSRWTDNADHPVVFSVGSGSWRRAHADRVPDGAMVEVATHDDPGGHGYAQKIVASFDGRDVELVRRVWR